MNNTPPEKNRRVLVIDDNRSIHDDFRKILSPAAATAEALDAAEMALGAACSRLRSQLEAAPGVAAAPAAKGSERLQ